MQMDNNDIMKSPLIAPKKAVIHGEVLAAAMAGKAKRDSWDTCRKKVGAREPREKNM